MDSCIENDNKILNYIYKILKYNPTDEERKENLYIVKILLNQDLIIEKNINKNVNNLSDNYNIGNYYILKEKDAEVVNTSWSKDFMDKYMNKDDKDLIIYLQNKDISLDMINKYLVVYNNIKLSKIQKNKEKDTLDYVIE
jgi:putative ribosome biogenesis GTPase RsgA